MYLITRVDVLLLILSLTAFVAACVAIVSGIEIAHDGKGDLNIKVFKKSIVVLAISLMGVVILPTKQDLLLIYGVGTTLDYIQENETVKQLPDKCIEALEIWVESLTDTKK